MGARLDKIKQFFSRIFRGEEKKLLTSGEQKVEQSSKQKEDFMNGLRVDTEDLLNPEVYQGDRLLTNILMHVGVKKEIAENPAVIREVSNYLGGIMPKIDEFHARYSSSAGIDGIMAHPTKEKIDEVIKAIQSSRIIGEDERKEIYKQSERAGKVFYYHCGIRINPEEGTLTIQDISGDQVGNFERGYFTRDGMHFSVKNIAFSTDENGGLIKKETVSAADSRVDNLAEERLHSTVQSDYYSTGIEFAQHLTEYGYKSRIVDGKIELDQLVTYEAYSERDIRNPFIRRVDVKQNELYDENNLYIPAGKREAQYGISHYESKGVHYFPMYPTFPEELSAYESAEHITVSNFRGSNDTVKIPVFFDTFDQAQQYYEKETKILIEEEIKLTRRSDRFYKGKKYLGERAGMDLEELDK